MTAITDADRKEKARSGRDMLRAELVKTIESNVEMSEMRLRAALCIAYLDTQKDPLTESHISRMQGILNGR